MAETDPLLALRSAIKSKTSITYVQSDGTLAPTLRNATSITLAPNLSLLKSIPTRYKNSSTADSRNPSSSPQDFFTLEAVYLAWHLKDAPGAEYMKQMRENGLMVGFVSITERKAVVEWLEGDQMVGERVVPIPGQIDSPPLP
jgi:parafibromin